MRALLVIFALVALIAGGVALVGQAVESFAGPSAVDYARQQAALAELERQQELAERLAPVDLAVAVAWRLVPLAAVVGGLVYLAVLGVAALARFRHERLPSAAGLLPVPVERLADVGAASLGAYHAAQLEAARRPNVPHSLNYHAPHYRSDGAAGSGLPALPAPDAATVPTFGELLSAGRIGRGQPLCLGVDLAERAPIWGDWRDLYSAGLGGKQGSGKSWTAASLIAQSLLGGARVILADPHAGDEESLATRLAPLLPFCELVAEEPAAVLEAARYAQDEFKRRRQAAQEKRPHDRTPVILVIDEWTSLLRGGMADTLPPILSDLTQEGRKYGVNALLLAQRWEAAAAGGSDVRNTLTAHYAHRMRGDELRMMTGMRAAALPGDPLELQPGQAYLFDTRGNVRRVATPLMNESDLARVAAMLGGGVASGAPSAAASAPRALGFRVAAREATMEATAEAIGGSSLPARQDAAEWTAEELRILAALREGKTTGEIAEELAGSKGGRAYKDAAARVAAVVHRLARVR